MPISEWKIIQRCLVMKALTIHMLHRIGATNSVASQSRRAPCSAYLMIMFF